VNVPYLVGVTLLSPEIGGAHNIAWADPTGAAATVLSTVNTIRNGNAALGVPSLANGLTYAQLTSPAVGGAVPNITGFPGKLRTPDYQEWNFQVQQAIDSKSRITLAYVGNHGYHEPYPNGTLNAYTGGSAGTGALIAGFANGAPPDPRFGSFTEWNSGAVSNNHEMTATYTRRLTAGFVVNANYTWAHTIDEISNGGLLNSGTSAYGIQGQWNPLSLRANNYGNADYDIRNSFNANYVWTEAHHFDNRAMSAILGGWIFSENFITRSGLPFTVVDGTTAIGDLGYHVGTTPAQLTSLGAQQNCQNGHSQCFNAADFTGASGLGLYPTQVRNQFRGPSFFNSDFTFGKNFHISERIRMTMGASIYNIFNHPNFQNPNDVWTGNGFNGTSNCSLAGSCGNITGQAAPPTGPYGSFFNGLPAGRVGQVQAKIVF
jgi:hypothetical protein